MSYERRGPVLSPERGGVCVALPAPSLLGNHVATDISLRNLSVLGLQSVRFVRGVLRKMEHELCTESSPFTISVQCGAEPVNGPG